MKKWIVKIPDKKIVDEFASQCDLSDLVLRIMSARGFAWFNQLADFFNDTELSDPFIMADMQKAVDIIEEAINDDKMICVYGDYDCDGITATALLYTYLQNIGANVIYHINEREDGYGMNIEAVRKLADKGVDLIVTVDNGISCLSEAEECLKLGVKLVITDHHRPPEILPRADAVVDPCRGDCPSTCKNLAGVGVALKLCAALDGGEFDAVLEQFSDICAIGTVADLVSLSGENRTIVRKGLLYLKNTENYGLDHLLNIAVPDRSKLNAGTLAFQVAPRINAAGRFSSPLNALEMLINEDQQTACRLADDLDVYNEQRKAAEAEIMQQIFAYIDEHEEILNDRVMILAGKGWHHGVIGIVCSRLLEIYGKPNIILSLDDDGTARGSARSLKGFNIHECFTDASEYLEKYGGHECAGGLTIKIENIPAFKEKVLSFAAAVKIMPSAVTECDIKIDVSDITVENVRSFSRLEPFGTGNPQPLFYMPSCAVLGIYPIGEGKYSKIHIEYMSKTFYALVFFASPSELFFAPGARIDLAVNLSVNSYNGKESVSIRVIDMKPAFFDENKFLAAKDFYERFSKGEVFPTNVLYRMKPNRNEMVKIYTLIRQLGGEAELERLFLRINKPSMNYCKLRIAADAFCQADLAQYIPSKNIIRLIPAKGKADLEQTDVIKRINEMMK